MEALKVAEGGQVGLRQREVILSGEVYSQGFGSPIVPEEEVGEVSGRLDVRSDMETCAAEG